MYRAPEHSDASHHTPTRLRERLVVVGNGMAGCRTVEEILARDADRYAITIFGAEPRVNYNRIMLSQVLAGELTFDETIINDEQWYAANDVQLVAGDPVMVIDRDAKQVVARSGRREPYDKLIIATGSEPFIIPVPGRDLPGVVTFRDADDVTRMIEAAGEGGSAVVIGGGLLGLEAAHGLALRGMSVTVLHLMPSLMERQLDRAAGDLLKADVEGRGINVLTGADTAEIVGTDQVAGVKLKDGRLLPARLVVLAVGIRPSTGLAAAAGLTIGRGIQVDDEMRTSDPAIFAVGECVEHREQCYGLVAPLFEMGQSLAESLTRSPRPYEGSVTSTKLKVSGIDLFSAGHFDSSEAADNILMSDSDGAIYKRLIVRDGRLVGVVLYGDVADGGYYFDLLRRGADVSETRDELIFGAAFASDSKLPTMASA